ncbi:hypothetical protein FZC33_00120 [Labrys sp. KNU-23]|uniref:hypothetical protein n=1 Tax=Labrys sp. KNU-23 TaxID=2789216 RepID=UPI0011F0447C|nr:hypothetical protein [Labrys sp. KNU-23]QEN84738.1 hypothetical protein FZC33_00120 [Labrys sp. KNU-23]
MARTIEAYATYHRKKELLTDHLQVATAGLYLLKRNIQTSNAPALLGSLVDACAVQHWGKGKHYKSADEKVDTALASLADQGVIQHVAAFDLFTRNLVQDIVRFSSHARDTLPHCKHDHQLLRLSPANRWVSDHCCHDLSGRLDTLSKRLDELNRWLGWRPSAKLAAALPLFELIRSIRNRIAHDDGMIGADLQELAASEEIKVALAEFRAEYAKRDLPALPAFKRGQRLNMTTVHAILFGAFLYEIAKELNAYATSLFNDEEYIDMAFYYSCVVEEHPFRTLRHRSAANRIAYFLAERYWRDRAAPGASAIINRLAGETLVHSSQPKFNSSCWKVALSRHQELL